MSSLEGTRTVPGSGDRNDFTTTSSTAHPGPSSPGARRASSRS